MSLIEQIKEHEGFRSTVYDDSLGIATIGFGFTIKDLELDLDIAEEILKRKLDKLKKRVNDRFHWVSDAPKPIQNVVYNMVYQLGLNGFSRFRLSIQYLADKNYEKASKEMLDSRWARQTPNRAIELSNIVKAQSNE